MAIIYVVIIASIIFLSLFGGGYFTYWLMRKSFQKNEDIIVPSFFSFNGGLFLFVCILLLTCILIDTLMFNPYEAKAQNVKAMMPFLAAAVILCFCGTFLSFSIFKDDKIIHRNIFHIWGKLFDYSDIVNVRIYINGDIRFWIWHRLRYIIEMKDGTKIDINTLQLQDRPMEDKNGVSSLKDILLIESRISIDVPHSITSDAYEELSSSHINLTEDLCKRFKKIV